MRKLEVLKVGMVHIKKKKKKTCFVSWKVYAYFSSCYFSINISNPYSFSFAIQRQFLELEVNFHNIFKSFKMKHR